MAKKHSNNRSDGTGAAAEPARATGGGIGRAAGRMRRVRERAAQAVRAAATGKPAHRAAPHRAEPSRPAGTAPAEAAPVDAGQVDAGPVDAGPVDRAPVHQAVEPARSAAAAVRVDVRPLLRVPPGEPVDLAWLDSFAMPGGPASKQEALAATAAIGERLARLQDRLFAQSTMGDPRRVLLVLQGMDTSGKGGTVRHVLSQVNPAGCRVHAFRTPTVEEKRHPFLWRIRRHLPQPGEIGIFDRSHYEDVTAARVRHLVPRSVWARRYSVINRFERSLADEGVSVVKVFLHIGADEQRDRLIARLDDPEARWKAGEDDVDERALWPEYQAAYAEALERCSTEAAPWYVVPADREWYRDWAVSKLLLEHLEAIGPQYPQPAFDVDKCRDRLRGA